MAGGEMEYKKLMVKVGDDETRSVEYAWQTDSDKVLIFIRYEGGHTDTIEYWPPDPAINDERALDLVRMCATLMFHWEKRATAH